jgi:hypothetical protein
MPEAKGEAAKGVSEGSLDEEARQLADKYGFTLEEARQLIAEHGRNNDKLRAAAGLLKAGRKQ